MTTIYDLAEMDEGGDDPILDEDGQHTDECECWDCMIERAEDAREHWMLVKHNERYGTTL